MSSPATGSGRKRATARQYSAEDQALNQIAKEAESRLAARRAARAEAREIRLREIERQQKESDEKEENKSKLSNDYRVSASSRYNNRRGSNDSGTSEESTRELKKEIADLEDKWKKAMMNNAQLDNEKQTYRYQVDILKDQFEEMEEAQVELQREHKDRCRELEQKKRDYKDLQDERDYLKQQLEMRDQLIEEYGLVFISNDTEEDKEGGPDSKKKARDEKGTTALVTPEAAAVLERLQGSLDDKLKEFAGNIDKLEADNKKLKQQLEEEKERSALAEKYSSPSRHLSNGPDQTQYIEDIKSEAQRTVNEYKFKLKKAEQDITQLEGTVIRLESQVKRYKTASENSEKTENELKAEKRKMQRELREAQANIEELTTEKEHLQKRMERLRSTRININ